MGMIVAADAFDPGLQVADSISRKLDVKAQPHIILMCTHIFTLACRFFPLFDQCRRRKLFW